MAKKNVDESPMMKQFRELKEKHPETLLLFRCGDFYETYGDDAKEAAKILGITLTWRTPQKRHAPGDYTDAMAGFPHHALDVYLPKLIRAGKRVAICDQLEDPKLTKKLVKRGITELVSPAAKNDDHELNELNETNQTSTTMEPKNNNQNESANVQDAQVNDNVTTEADVAEVDDIVPVVTKKKVADAMVQAAPATTMPLGQHGTLIIASGGGDEPRRKSGNNGKAAPTTTEEPKKSDVRGKKEDVPQPSAISHQPSTLPTVTLVVYTTRHGDQAPRIEGFGGEDDPRWKRHYDEKQRLKAEKEKADKHNDKLRKAMKGKSKEHKALVMKKWITVPNDPFNAGYFTDRTTGDKTYTMVMGSKYMDVARELVNAYNSGDADAIAQAEQAVIDRRASINADYEAQREERKAAKMEDGRRKMEEPATAQAGYSDQDVADMLRKVMAGGDVPENIKKLLQAA